MKSTFVLAVCVLSVACFTGSGAIRAEGSKGIPSPAKAKQEAAPTKLERLLNDLEKRCRQMLAMQRRVKSATVAIDKAIQTNKDQKPSRANRIAASKVAARQQDIINQAKQTLEKLKAKPACVAFEEVFRQFGKDLKVIKARLQKAEVGGATQNLEQDSIEELMDVIKLLQKTRQDIQQRK